MSAHYYSSLSIDDHAKWYVKFIQKRGSFILTFYPKRKTAGATSNKFRQRVLEKLLRRKKPYGEKAGVWLPRLEKFAKEAGFTINEVNREDYK